MTLREFIDELLDMAADETIGETIEVVATDEESGETYTPVISIGPDKDGVRRLRVC